MRRKLKIRATRRRWVAARTLPELGDLMALWLEGELPFSPGYGGGPDEETTELIPALVAANRAGFLTDQSQPGYDGPGFDRMRWQQRAAVSGLVGDEELLNRLRRAAESAGLLVLISHPRLLPHGKGAICTTRGFRPHTAFGEYMPPRLLRHIWRGISRAAMSDVLNAWQVCLIDPEIGRNDRLWPLLADTFATTA
ncbi:hypothetical protein GT030_29565 [Streptomyces sp. SID1328]|uniref:DUF6919 domain-containing protein n=1 Tax=Streptomyces sp. SID1328 TaxID=2690250 RepID=UPI00136F050F|nr:hypothetical protein [Streptomyces sp. SID1328]MYV42902.1 hypothetical protein [Streptomyces sp. SID1328]